MNVLVNRFIFLFVGLMLSIPVWAQMPPPAQINQIFPDANFALAIANAPCSGGAGNPSAIVTQAQLNTCLIIRSPASGIQSLEGVQYLQDLYFLEVYNNSISAIPDLTHLNGLRIINLDANRFSSIPIAQLPLGLTDLQIGYQQVPQLSLILTDDFSVFTMLKVLVIARNGYTDVNGISLPDSLIDLYLNGNELTQLILAVPTSLSRARLENNHIVVLPTSWLGLPDLNTSNQVLSASDINIQSGQSLSLVQFGSGIPVLEQLRTHVHYGALNTFIGKGAWSITAFPVGSLAVAPTANDGSELMNIDFSIPGDYTLVFTVDNGLGATRLGGSTFTRRIMVRAASDTIPTWSWYSILLVSMGLCTMARCRVVSGKRR